MPAAPSDKSDAETAPSSNRGSEVAVGDVIDGKFRVDKILGIGGMGVVVLATHLELDERFALKFLKPDLAASQQTVERFAREAKAAARIKSEHVARVHDVGRRPDGTPFLVMEYLEGTDLGRLLAKRGRLPVAEACEYIIDACEGLAHAHAAGIVHRDVKPENLLRVRHASQSHSIKLLDFGISKVAVDESEVPLTSGETSKMSTAAGTPAYMSPEQVRGGRTPIDARSDIWSLGVVLYEMLSGRPAFSGDTIPEVCAAVLESSTPELSEDVESAGELQEILDRCLQKAPENRFQSVGELAIALLPFASRRARSVAERAVQIVRDAGIGGDEIELPPSIYPPASDRMLPVARSSDPEMRKRARNANTVSLSGYPTAALARPTRSKQRTIIALLVLGIVAVLAATAVLRFDDGEAGAVPTDEALEPRGDNSGAGAAYPRATSISAPIAAPSLRRDADQKSEPGAPATSKPAMGRASPGHDALSSKPSKPSPIEPGPKKSQGGRADGGGSLEPDLGY